MAEKERTLEESFAELEKVIAEMEAKDTSLDRSFQLFMEGTGLLKECNEKIDRVEKSVLKVTGEKDLKKMDEDCLDQSSDQT
jgi:exodeoxyribonuclease VII small subunit